MLVTESVSENTRGWSCCLRLNASSCRVTDSARSAARRISTTSAQATWSSPSAREGKLRVADDGGQRVVQVVRHAACETADRFELLRLPKLLLDPPAIGDVLHRPDQTRPPALLAADGVGALVDPALLPVGADDAVLDLVGLADLCGDASRFSDGVPIVGVHEPEERLGRAGKLLIGHAEDAMRFTRPLDPVRSVQLGQPAADVRHLLRLLEHHPLREQGRGRAAVGGHSPDHAPPEAVRGDEPIEQPAVLEAHRVADFVVRRRPPEAADLVRVLEQAIRRGQNRVESLRGQRLGGQIENREIAPVAPDNAAIEIEHDDGVVGRLKRGFEQGDSLLERQGIGAR